MTSSFPYCICLTEQIYPANESNANIFIIAFISNLGLHRHFPRCVTEVSLTLRAEQSALVCHLYWKQGLSFHQTCLTLPRSKLCHLKVLKQQLNLDIMKFAMPWTTQCSPLNRVARCSSSSTVSRHVHVAQQIKMPGITFEVVDIPSEKWASPFLDQDCKPTTLGTSAFPTVNSVSSARWTDLFC